MSSFREAPGAQANACRMNYRRINLSMNVRIEYVFIYFFLCSGFCDLDGIVMVYFFLFTAGPLGC